MRTNKLWFYATNKMTLICAKSGTEKIILWSYKLWKTAVLLVGFEYYSNFINIYVVFLLYIGYSYCANVCLQFIGFGRRKSTHGGRSFERIFSVIFAVKKWLRGGDERIPWCAENAQKESQVSELLDTRYVSLSADWGCLHMCDRHLGFSLHFGGMA